MPSIAPPAPSRPPAHHRHLPLLPLLLLLLFARGAEAGSFWRFSEDPPTAPCPAVTTADPFDLRAYVTAHPWYVQQQQPTRYQPSSDLFCVRASYAFESDATDADALARASVAVLNTANRGAVDGPPQNARRTKLRAVVDPSARASSPSKLRVGPRFLPRAAYGPYWIVAVSPATPGEGGYDWAVVSGGAPTIPGATPGTCRTGEGVNDAGLWLFSRDPVASEDAIAAMRAAAEAKGFDLSRLENVEQRECEYPPE